MVWKEHGYDKIPGTYVFDGKRAHPAYATNKLLFSFNEEKNRQEFARDPVAYCDKMGVKNEYKDCILNNDFLGLLRLGANIYYVAKMCIPRGTSVQDAGAAFQGITTEEFKQKLMDHAEGLEQEIATRGGYWNG